MVKVATGNSDLFAMEPEMAADSLDRLCHGATVEVPAVLAGMLTWVEEETDGESGTPTSKDIAEPPEFNMKTLPVHWRDPSIAYSAEMRAPEKDWVDAAPKRYMPSALLHATLDRCERDEPTRMSSPAMISHRSSGPYDSHASLQNLLHFLKEEPPVTPKKKDDRGDDKILETWKAIMSLMTEWLDPEGTSPDEVLRVIREKLEGCCKVRVASCLGKTRGNNRKTLKEEGRSIPINEVLDTSYRGNVNLMEDHPLKSVSHSPVCACVSLLVACHLLTGSFCMFSSDLASSIANRRRAERKKS